MAECTSERRNRLRRPLSPNGADTPLHTSRAGAAVAALVLLAPGVFAAGRATANAPANATASATAKVTAVRFWSLGDLTRISVEVSSDFKYHSERLSDPDRLFFDIRGAKPAMSQKRMDVVPVGDMLLKQIRVAETQPGVTRVVLDLEAHTPPVTFTASQLSNPDRLVIEVRLKDKPSPPEAGSVSGAKAITGASTDAALSELATDVSSVQPLDLSTSAGATSVPATSAGEAVMAKPALRAYIPPAPAPRSSLPILRMTASEAPDLSLVASVKVSLPAPRVVIAPPKADPSNAAAPLPSDPAPLPSFASLNMKPAPAARSSVAPSITSTNASISPSASVAPASASSAPASLASAGPERDAVAAKTGSAAVPSLTRVLGLKLGRVVIDAGHGGHDAGTHGVSGLLEKDVVLDVSLRLGALLQDRLGSEVIYTRNDDTYVPLEERTRIANDHKADLFLSIHANSSPFKSVGGVETYYLNFTTTKSSLDLAAKENAGSQSSIFDLKDVLAKIAMKDKIDESREFASSIQTSLFAVSAKNNAAVKNRGIKKAPFVVLIGASMPSVLAEIGFLTNSADEALLRKPEQRQKIAEALYKGVAAYAESLSHFQVAKRD